MASGSITITRTSSDRAFHQLVRHCTVEPHHLVLASSTGAPRETSIAGPAVVAYNLMDVGPEDGGFACVAGSHKAAFTFPPRWKSLKYHTLV